MAWIKGGAIIKNDLPYRIYGPANIQNNIISIVDNSVDTTGVVPLVNTSTILHPKWNEPFEIGIKCKFSATYGKQEIMGSRTNGYYHNIGMEIADNALTCFISEDGGSWKYYVRVTLADLNYIDTWLYINLSYDGTNITITCSDGENSVEQTNAVSTIYYSTSYDMIFGSMNGNSSLVAKYMTLDLNHTYIKDSSGNIIWGSI